MTAYAIANIQSIAMGPPIVEYLERIDGTLAPYGGRFVVHGDPADVREGDFTGDLIAIEFPTIVPPTFSRPNRAVSRDDGACGRRERRSRTGVHVDRTRVRRAALIREKTSCA
jgi:hypothetical protein